LRRVEMAGIKGKTVYVVVKGEKGEGYLIRGIWSSLASAVQSAAAIAKIEGMSRYGKTTTWYDKYEVDYVAIHEMEIS
jgi:hypothetical protein